MLDDCNGQGSTLCRVRAGTQLVKQDQGVFLAGVKDLDNVLHVCRKGGEVLLNALLIPDIGENVRKNRQCTAVRRRDMQPALVHCRKQSNGF